MNVQDLLDDFELLDDWEDRYRYLIELGRELDPMPELSKNTVNKVNGCASQVWLKTQVIPAANGSDIPVLSFIGDSDAHIVRGLIYILLVVFSQKRADEILEIDIKHVFHEIGLDEHLSPQRSNGVNSMVGRIKSDAQLALKAAP